MLGFLKRLFGGGDDRDWTGDFDCYEALREDERTCPKCGSKRVDLTGFLGEELSRYERPYDMEKDEWIEYDVTYSILCKCKCLECGYQWEKYSQVTKYERNLNPYFSERKEATGEPFDEEQKASEEAIMQEEVQVEEEEIASVEEELAECDEEIVEGEEDVAEEVEEIEEEEEELEEDSWEEEEEE